MYTYHDYLCTTICSLSIYIYKSTNRYLFKDIGPILLSS